MIAKKNIFNVFVIFLFLHVAIWTLIPSISNVNLPLDTIEALAWGSNLDWGYEKHPPLSAFAVEIVHYIFGSQDWAYYLLSQFFVAIAFIYVWKFSEEFFDQKIYSLLSVLLLEGIYFYNFTTPEFNVNISQLPFYALTVYYFWKSLETNDNFNWLLFGIFSALGFLSKYLFIYLLLGLFIYFLLTLKKNKKFIIKYFFSILVSLLILIPHFIWLINNDFVTLLYGFNRTGLINSNFNDIADQLSNIESSFSNNIENIDTNFLEHIVNPLVFIFKQIIILVPISIMIRTLIKKYKFNFNIRNNKFFFLLIINFVPLILFFITAVFTGATIRTMWMTPFYLFIGTLLVYIYRQKIILNKLNLKKFIFIFIFIFITSPIAYLFISLHDSTKRTDYPGKEIARLVQNKWNDNFFNEVKIVVGDEWFGGNLSYHLDSRPNWTRTLKDKTSELKTAGGVIYVGNPKILKKVCPGFFFSI